MSDNNPDETSSGRTADTRIAINESTRERLKNNKRGGETYDELLRAMLDQYDPDHDLWQGPGDETPIELLSDGHRLVLADGSVVRPELSDHDDVDLLVSATDSEDDTAIYEEGRVRLAFEDDPEAAAHPLVERHGAGGGDDA